MPNNNSSNLTWRQIPVIIGILILFITGGGYIYTKADKTELQMTEVRCEKKIDKVEKRVEEDIRDIKLKQDKIYTLLLSIKFGNPIKKRDNGSK